MTDHTPTTSQRNLEPIAGVDLELYAKVARGIAPYGYDQSKLPQVARAFGVSPEDWARAREGWLARIHEDRAVAAQFNELYTRS